MEGAVTIESGFVEVEAGTWLMGRAQPAAFFGKVVRRRRKGWVVRDRSRLDFVETTGRSRLAYASRPFLTHIPCAAPIFAVADKVLVAPLRARLGARFIKAIPFSVRAALCVTEFGQPPETEGQKSKVEGPSADASAEGRSDDSTIRRSDDAAWVVMSTASRTARLVVADGESLSVRPESVVAWSGPVPTGFCPKLGLWDVLLPRGPKDLLFNFYGPAIVWVEGSGTAQPVWAPTPYGARRVG